MAIHEVGAQGFTHQQLWNCAKTLLSQPETHTPADGHFFMAGMLMLYFTYEAYLNFAGSQLVPEVWAKERTVFSRRPYRGTEGKLKLICEKAGIEVRRDERPYRTIDELRDLRDFLAHGKPERYAYDVEVREGEHPDLFAELLIYKLVTGEKADRALSDTKEFLEYLHTRICERYRGLEFCRFKALGFPLSSAAGGERT